MKRYHLLSSGLVVILASMLIGCSSDTTVTQTVTQAQTQTVPITATLYTSSPKSVTTTTTTEPQVPINFITYTSEGLFSISYPSDWEPAQSVIEELEATVKELLLDIDAGLPVDQVTAIFLAGLPTFSGWLPNVNIVIQSLTGLTLNLDMLVDAGVEGVRSYIDDFREYSRINTTVNGREAIILGWEGTIPTLAKTRVLQMYIIVDKIAWNVTCTPPSGEFSEWEEEFYNILNSFMVF